VSERERGEAGESAEEAAEEAATPALPEQTKDDTDVGWGEAADPESARDEHERWLLEQRPPHWD
jgi:hypothetical protein